MLRHYICGLVAAVVMCTASEAATPPLPIGTYACGHNETTFTVNTAHANYSYTVVSVLGASNMTACSVKVNPGDTVTLKVKPEDCNVTVDGGGEVSLQFLIAQNEMVYLAGDVLNNVTCNIRGTGEQTGTASLSGDVSVDGEIESVTADSPLPKASLVAKNKDGGDEIVSVNLGDMFQLCVKVDTTASPYRGFNVGKCDYEGIEVTSEKGCKKAVDGVMTLSGTPEGFSHKENDTSSCVVLPAFRGKGKMNSDKVSIECEVTYYLKEKKQKTDACLTKRLRREAPLTDGVTREVRLVLNIEDPRERNSASDGCPGHINSTVFYVVVSILAGLLVVTIAVAIFLARRGRMSHDFNSGKDNSAFEMAS